MYIYVRYVKLRNLYVYMYVKLCSMLTGHCHCQAPLSKLYTTKLLHMGAELLPTGEQKKLEKRLLCQVDIDFRYVIYIDLKAGWFEQ
jgi:hypothetical protein